MQIGLIGGIGPAAQDYYVRQLIALFAARAAALELTTVHADAPTLLGSLAADRRDEQAAIFARLSERLSRAGAAFVAVTSIAGHFCRAEFAARSALPVIDMIDTVSAAVAAQALTRIGILGTRTAMETQLFGGISSATLVAPPELELSDVHAAYAAMATAGAISPEQQTIFDRAAQRLIDVEGAEAIMLGGTDLVLAYDSATAPFPIIDCAAIHCKAIADHAMGELQST